MELIERGSIAQGKRLGGKGQHACRIVVNFTPLRGSSRSLVGASLASPVSVQTHCSRPSTRHSVDGIVKSFDNSRPQNGRWRVSKTSLWFLVITPYLGLRVGFFIFVIGTLSSCNIHSVCGLQGGERTSPVGQCSIVGEVACCVTTVSFQVFSQLPGIFRGPLFCLVSVC